MQILHCCSLAFCTKNYLLNINGFGTTQLVLNRKTTLPSFINNQFPVQESTLKAFDLGLYVSTLHSARKKNYWLKNQKKTETWKNLKKVMKNQMIRLRGKLRLLFILGSFTPLRIERIFIKNPKLPIFLALSCLSSATIWEKSN